MRYEITPSKLSGKITPPPSKSYAHRAVICAALYDGESRISNIAMSKDVKATVGAMRALGAHIEVEGSEMYVRGISGRTSGDVEIDCGESGSTMRFLIPVALALCDGNVHMTGGGKLGVRPLDTFIEIFESQGIYYRNDSSQAGLDLTFRGSLLSDEFEVAGNVSSQFISGLLFALPLLPYDSKIRITTPLESRDYIRMTMDVMSAYGVVTSYDPSVREFTAYGGQKYDASLYSSRPYEVEADYSQAAFYYVARAIGNDVEVQGLKRLSAQGDKAIVDMLTLLKATPSDKKVVFDVRDVPDIVPALCVACALRNGSSAIVNAGRLRIKECDRLHAIVEGLNSIGASLFEGKDKILINGVPRFKGGVELDGYNDHRMVMAFAIAATACENPVIINGVECVDKSYPDFFEHYRKLGGVFREVGSGDNV